MSVFGNNSKEIIESDIYKLRKRLEAAEYFKDLYGRFFVDIVWDDPDDPYCCCGMVLLRSSGVDGVGQSLEKINNNELYFYESFDATKY